MSSFGAQEIVRERDRQVSSEGWTSDHDDTHDDSSLARAAICYIGHATKGFDAHYRKAPPPPDWPWDAKWWNPKGPIRDLVRAGALIAAEIDRLFRRKADVLASKESSHDT